MADALDDFLTGKTPKPPGGSAPPSVVFNPDKLDAFLTGANAPPPVATPPPPDADMGARLRAMAGGGPDVDAFGRPMADPELGTAGGRRAVQAGQEIIPSAIQGFRRVDQDGRDTSIQTPYFRDLFNQGPLGRYVYNPLLDVVGSMGGAVGSAIGQTAYTVGTALDPSLGRDLYMGNQVVGALLPQVAGPRAGLMPPQAPDVNALRPRTVQERMAPPPVEGQSTLGRINALIHHDEQWNNPENPTLAPPDARFLPPGDAPPAPPPDFVPPNKAGPRVGGTPPGVIPNGLTPEQIAEFEKIPEALPPMQGEIKTPEDAANRADQIIRHFASIGNKEPIPGAVGALPTITGNSGLATLYRAVRDSDTPVPFTTLETAAKKTHGGALADLVKTPGELDAAEAALDAKTEPMRQAAFANKTEADPAPVVATIDHILASPSGMSDAVVGALKKVRDKLVDKDGNILDRAKDPEQLYGLDKAIRKDVSPLAAGTTSDARLAAHELLNVRDVLRPVIEGAAPGFKDYMATYSKDSRVLDEMRYLQSRNLTNVMDEATLGKVHAMLADIDKQRNAPGIKLPDSLSPETLAKLRSIHEQMQRENFTATAGKALGSNTFQNLATNTMTGNIAGHMGNALVSTGTGALTGMATGMGGLEGALAGNVLGAGLRWYGETQAGKAAARQSAGQQMLMKELRDRLLNIDNKGVESLRRAPP
jgi:hypothetical protein